MPEKSLLCIDRDNPIRLRCYRCVCVAPFRRQRPLPPPSRPVPVHAASIIIHPWFERAIIIAIVLNCIILAINDPLDPERVSTRNRIIDESELYFTIIFTIELLLKVVAMGFFGKNSYLADRWNWIDFIVVVTGARVRLLRALCRRLHLRYPFCHPPPTMQATCPCPRTLTTFLPCARSVCCVRCAH